MPWQIELRAKCIHRAVEILARMPALARPDQVVDIATIFERYALTGEVSGQPRA